jgi:protein-S-isoprenylcysteine O-methyltransferase Ste14
LALWCAAFFLANDVFFRFHEEPSLERRFGNEYSAYRREVPRWLLRRTPWPPA